LKIYYFVYYNINNSDPEDHGLEIYDSIVSANKFIQSKILQHHTNSEPLFVVIKGTRLPVKESIVKTIKIIEE